MGSLFNKRRLLQCSQALLACLGIASLSHADSTPEYRLEAAVVFNFVQFVDWPSRAFADEREPIAICVLGTDPFGATLDTLAADTRIDGRSIKVSRYEHVDQIDRCHLVFVNLPRTRLLQKDLQRLSTMSALTVSDSRGFIRHGGMIELATVNNELRLRVNVDAARKATLRLSSKLLKHSDIVTATGT